MFKSICVSIAGVAAMPSMFAQVNPHELTTACRQWADAWNNRWHKAFPMASASRCFTITGADSGAGMGASAEAFICTEKNYTTGTMVKCVMFDDLYVRLSDELTFAHPYQILAKYFEHRTCASPPRLMVHDMQWVACHGEAGPIALITDKVGEEVLVLGVLIQPKAARCADAIRNGDRTQADDFSENEILADLARELNVDDERDEAHELENMWVDRERAENHEDVVGRRERDMINSHAGTDTGTGIDAKVEEIIQDNPDLTPHPHEVVDEAILQKMHFHRHEKEVDPEVAIDTDLARPVHASWRDAATMGARLLDDTAKAKRDRPVGGTRRLSSDLYELSLVMLEIAGVRSVNLVTWKDPVELIGRIARIDHADRVIFSLPAVEGKDRDLSHCEIIHPAIGVTMLKVKAAMRPRVPSDILRIKMMWEVALTAHTRDPISALSDTLLPCSWCSDDSRDEAIHQCALCLCAWHDSCATKLRAHVQAQAVPEIEQRAVTLPRLFISQGLSRASASTGQATRAPLCKLCQDWSSVPA